MAFVTYRFVFVNGFIKHKALGARFFQYSATNSKEEYNSHIQKKAVNKYFNGSYMGFISQLIEQKEISIEELKDLISLVENNNQ